jgi:LAO/AO transport system kinase
LENDKIKQTAYNERSWNSQPEIFSPSVVKNIQKYRKLQPSSEELVTGILSGNITALSRAITLVESTNPDHLLKTNEVINACLPHANKSVRIGITGVPGVGKAPSLKRLENI